MISGEESEKIIQELQQELDQSLKISAPLIWFEGEISCNRNEGGYGCAGYHRTWQFMVLWRMNRSMRSETGRFLHYFRQLARRPDYKRIFISGASDYYLQAHILRAYKVEKQDINLTVFDLCKTPLDTNRWYAARQGVGISTIQGNILNYEPEQQYDAVCCHSLFLWLSLEQQEQAVKTWHSLLRPGGIVVTSTRLFEGELGSCQTLVEQFNHDFRERFLRVAREKYPEHGINPEDLTDARYQYMIHGRERYIVNDAEVYRDIFENNGFAIETLEFWDDANKRDGLPEPKKGNKGRLHIIARRI